MLNLASLIVSFTKDFERLILGRGGKGEIARIGQHLPRFHDPVDLILKGFVLLVTALLGKRNIQLSGCPPALAGMRLVNDDGELSSAMLVPDFIQNYRELLNR